MVGLGEYTDYFGGTDFRDFFFPSVVDLGEYTVALPFALVGATVGALMCYMMSFAVLRGAVMKRFPSRVSWLKNTVMGHDNVFFLVLSLRLSPMIPAWFLSQTSVADISICYTSIYVRMHACIYMIRAWFLTYSKV